jgi:hypothetical protein
MNLQEVGVSSFDVASVRSQDGRLILGEITPEIQWLRQQYGPEVFSKSLQKLCKYTPINLIGSLITLGMLGEIEAQYKQARKSMPLALGCPVQRVERGKLFHFKDGRYEEAVDIGGQQLEANNVLLKWACGKPAGVVLGPPYTGLLVSVMDETGKDLSKLCLSRVWNDQRLFYPNGRINYPYRPRFINLSETRSDNLVRIFDSKFNWLVGNYQFSSEAFEFLAKELLGESINLDSFPRTRTECI